MLVEMIPDVHDEARFVTKRAAEILGIHPNTVREYVKVGLMRPIFRKESSRPYFTGREIKRFWRDKL